MNRRSVPVALSALALILVGCAVQEPAATAERTRSGWVEPSVSTSASGSASASASSATPSQTTPSASPKPACPQGVTLPSGVDPRACGPMPSNAKVFTEETIIASPSKNIGCDLWPYFDGSLDGSLSCVILQSTIKFPAKPADCEYEWVNYVGLESRVTVGECRSDPSAASMALSGFDGFTYETVPYGSIVAIGQVACLSASEGMTCWNTKSGHGFQLARASLKTW